MNKIKNELLFTFLKLFIFMFGSVVVLSILIKLVWYAFFKHAPLDMNSIIDVFSVFVFSLTWSLFSTHRYTKSFEKIEINEQEKDDLISKLKLVLQKMHWKLEKETPNQIIFKSSIFQTLWKETIEVRIEANEISLIGARYYIEKILKKFEQEVSTDGIF